MKNAITLVLLAIITLGSYRIGRVVDDQYWKAKVEEAVWQTRQENAVVYSAPCSSTTVLVPTITYCGISPLQTSDGWIVTGPVVTSATATTGTCIAGQPWGR